MRDENQGEIVIYSNPDKKAAGNINLCKISTSSNQGRQCVKNAHSSTENHLRGILTRISVLNRGLV